MDRREEILTILIEECGEVIQAATKILRFGEDSVWEGRNGLQILEAELGDLYCMIDMLHQEDMISYTELDEQAQRKTEKLKKWSNLFKDMI